MRKSIASACVIAGTIMGNHAFAQQADSTGLPGDNFSLTGALEMFKKAESPEKFEQMINTQDNNVNNLDLNGDGDIDYIKVIDKGEGNAHALVLQDVVSESERQDVAVIEVEKESDGKASLQIVGDADIYGEEMIVEPKSEQMNNAPQPTAPVTVNVWAWPAVRYVYGPGYTLWVSPWGWRARPVWWRPWRPVRYAIFYPYRAPYYNRYVIVNRHTVVRAHRLYTPVRTTSVMVQTRHQPAVSNYRATRTTRTVTTTGRNGHVRSVQKTTTVKGRRGAGSKSTRVRRRN